MPDSLCHVSIHCDAAGHGATVDLSLPVAMTVGELLPWIVDALDAADGTALRWRLTHLGGHDLNESATLSQNDVHDGDLLVLAGSREEPTPDRSLTAALTVDSTEDALSDGLRVTACLWACALGVVALAWTGLAGSGLDRIAVAAVAAAAVTAVAVAAPRFGLSSAKVAALDVAALAHVAVLGFLVVPAGPAPANFFLAAIAAGSLGAVLMRVSGCGTEILIAVVTVAGVVAAATGFAALWPSATPVLGSLVSALGVGLLPLTPRLSIALARLTPPVPGYPDDEMPEPDGFDVDSRALAGHRYLAGLVAGCSAAAALGTAILTFAGPRRVTAVEAAFAAAVGVALLLRSRSYGSSRCRTVAGISGFLSLTAAFVLVVAWDPVHGNWTGFLAAGIGIAVVWPLTIHNPAAARVADSLEYAALAAVAPLACWLAGAFDIVRDLALR
ncbi:type VII secretion integral membrane protein EccD [Mycolicibacterium peregrinum]|uniref:Type VII secretion integral membrane protein EccD n=1 Tax=Mycolicibacterium peregrinum TaxID=43304 RepID=A0A4Z0HU32_MYCPR|nr:type VII secretion integral membrane protein EccD [Mycolicibacterium peregrinum]TGB44445.1 type VII secretion integral membrane protein EccD [Mycolicibacterium peregrinum]TGB47144.1 type VII secretion integral membrane protein EccD [Mycolicibacterium peregrinum]